MFSPFLTSEEVSHFPNQHFYFIFEKLDKVSISMQFIASQTFVKSLSSLYKFLTFVKNNQFICLVHLLEEKKPKKNPKMSMSLVDYNPVDLYSDPPGIFSIKFSLGLLLLVFLN